MFMKRDKDLSALPPFQYFDGSLELIFDEDDKLSKRDGTNCSWYNGTATANSIPM